MISKVFSNRKFLYDSILFALVDLTSHLEYGSESSQTKIVYLLSSLCVIKEELSGSGIGSQVSHLPGNVSDFGLTARWGLWTDVVPL